MSGAKKICVILDKEGTPIAATPFHETAQAFVASGGGHRFLTVPRVTSHSAASLQQRTDHITDRLVKDAISAKLQGTSLSNFAKARGVRYADLRDAVNAEWGYSKPWPTLDNRKKKSK